MLPTNVINALQALAQTAKPPVALTSEAPKAVADFKPGQQLQSTVQEKVSEGVFKVQVAGQTLQMRLPGNIRAGDSIKLEVISLQPRITFGIAASTNPLSTPEQIGSTARMIADLSGRPIERPIVQQSGNRAVWEAGQQVPDAKVLAGALRETLGKSGLFYESHQAQWVRGERSIHQLLQEPQNLLTGKTAQWLASGQHAVPGGGAEQAQQASGQGASEKAASAPQQNPAAQARAAETAQPVARELTHLVQQQLHTLEQHHLVWMGQVWPGQQMQWEIQGQPEHHVPPGDERQWSTEMELDLPNLGGVHARLVFGGNGGLRLALRADTPETAALFNGALPRLKQALSEAHVPLASAVVEKP